MGIDPLNEKKASISGRTFSQAASKEEFIKSVDKVVKSLKAGKLEIVESIISSEGDVLKVCLEHNEGFSPACVNAMEEALSSKQYQKLSKVANIVYAVLPPDSADEIVQEAACKTLKDTLSAKKVDYEKALKVTEFIYTVFDQKKCETTIKEIVNSLLEDALKKADFSRADIALHFLKDSLNKNDDINHTHEKDHHDEVVKTLAEVGEKVITEKIRWGGVCDVPEIISYLARNGVIDLKPLLTSEEMVDACICGVIVASSYLTKADRLTKDLIIDYMKNFGLGDQVDRVLRDAYRNGIDKSLEQGNPGIANNIFINFQTDHKEIVQEEDIYKIMARENSLLRKS